MIGCLSLNGNYVEVLIMVLFGILGFVFRKFEYESAPLVFGMILSSPIENKLRQSLLMSEGSFGIFFTRPIALCFMVMFGQGLWKMIIVLAITGWAEYARTVRGTVLSIREKEYVEAAHALGFGPWTIMVKYLLINAITPVLILSSVQVPRVIMLEATLSFLGLGVPVTTPSIGLAIARGYQVLFSGSWWASIFPGLALMLLVACINIFADWLRDALEPRSREQV